MSTALAKLLASWPVLKQLIFHRGSQLVSVEGDPASLAAAFPRTEC